MQKEEEIKREAEIKANQIILSSATHLTENEKKKRRKTFRKSSEIEIPNFKESKKKSKL